MTPTQRIQFSQHLAAVRAALLRAEADGAGALAELAKVRTLDFDNPEDQLRVAGIIGVGRTLLASALANLNSAPGKIEQFRQLVKEATSAEGVQTAGHLAALSEAMKDQGETLALGAGKL